MLDASLAQRRPFMAGALEGIVKQSCERLNEFGHGGLLSTALDLKRLPPGVGNKILAASALVLIIFLGNVFILENLDLAPLEAIQREFDETRTEARPSQAASKVDAARQS